MHLADGKEPYDRIVPITDERIRQILTAAAAAAGLKEEAFTALAALCARLARASAWRPGGHDPRHARPCVAQ